jgi:hypothetical protein
MDQPSHWTSGPDLAELNQKLDLLTAQVQFLTEQAQIAERQRQERAELMRDLMPIVNDAFALAWSSSRKCRSTSTWRTCCALLKRCCATGRRREAAQPAREHYGPGRDRRTDPTKLSRRRSTCCRRRSTRATSRFPGRHAIADNVVTSFTEEDVEKLGDNVVLMLNTVKDMTQPEILGLVRAIVAQSEVEVAKPVNTSLLALIGQMRDPNVRRGLALTMRLLSVVGAQGKNGK